MSKYLTLTLLGGILAAGILAALATLLWPPGPVVGSLLATLALLLAIALTTYAAKRRRYREFSASADAPGNLTDDERAAWRMQVLAERERYLELRELNLGRQMRALQRAGTDYIDILDKDPEAEELERLVAMDRELLALIDAESRRAFERIRNNRYGKGAGVDVPLIFADIRDFIEAVARLYRFDKEHPLLETEIELVAKSLSSTALHLLVVVDGLPINLKTYNAASMYRLIRRGVSYYGTYKAFRPYLEQGMNVLQLARLALGMNPIAVGGAWVAGKLASHGARAIGERVLQRQALQLLTDFIRVIAFEAAMLYGGGFRHRDANWVLGAEIVNLEVARGDDLAGRDAALVKLCNLALRHEFDRLRLLNRLATGDGIDVAPVQPLLIMTERERMDAATVLASHVLETGVDESLDAVIEWRMRVESNLEIELDLPTNGRPRAGTAVPGQRRRPAGLLRRLGRRLGGRLGQRLARPRKSQ